YPRSAGWTVLMVLALISGFHPSRAAAADRLEFELATLNGSGFIKLDDFVNRAILINVWGTECPPCVKETPLLNAQSQIYAHVQFLGIATDDRISSLRFAGRFHVRYPQLQAPRNPTGLLRQLGDSHGALPFTLVLDTKHRMCASRLGEVDAGWISSAMKACAGR
ncbi:MAG TPA: TlpA disulfide reductase family protein, partial [Steroidobacteraceae bacterium]|nr:TlpA disulfide reductase family protein [Steroidobacteraceae bacterium]